MAAATDTDVAGLEAKIKEQGDQVRDLKAAKASKEDIDAAVAVLKELKADFEAQAGPMELPTNENNNNLLRIRHSSAHVMAMAVQRLYPKAQVTIGPWIDNGFYYDFDLQGEAFDDSDLKKIKKEMDSIVKKKYPILHEVVSRDEARTRIQAQNEPYKLELLDSIPEGEDISIYHIGEEWWDLCAGPHVEDTGKIQAKALELERVSGAYWRGDEKRAMLQRVYGTAWESVASLRPTRLWC